MKYFSLTFLFLFFIIENAHSELLPEQVALIANSASKESMELSIEYAKKRNIPESNIIVINSTKEENIRYKDFILQIKEPIKEQLLNKNIADKIKSLALIYEVPLHILAPEIGIEERKIIIDAENRLQQARNGLHEIKNQAKIILGEEKEERLATNVNDFQNIKEVENLLQRISAKIQTLPEERQQLETKKLTQLLGGAGGFSAILKFIRPAPGTEQSSTENNIKRLKSETENIKQIISLLDQVSTEENRRRAYTLSERVYGLSGIIARATKELDFYSFKEADSSTDSELALLWWESKNILTSGKLPNPLYHLNQETALRLSQAAPVLLVSRLDAPTRDDVHNLISNSLKAEKTGLIGDVYIDTRGRKFSANDAFSLWDQNMTDLGWLIRNKTNLPVNIDKHEELIEDAHNTAIYVGWYQLRKFQGDFSFVPGGMGFHIASEEAVSIHNPEETGWCRNLLKRNAAFTLGAVSEPYLEEFPMPLELFGLLLSGKYSLSEAYYLSLPHLSWRITLIADPLYNPFKNSNYKISTEDIKVTGKDSNVYKNLPPEPGKIQYLSPTEAIEAQTLQKNKIKNDLEKFFEAIKKND